MAGISKYRKSQTTLLWPPEVEKIYGKEPKVLDILIPVEDEEKWGAAVLQTLLQDSRTRL